MRPGPLPPNREKLSFFEAVKYSSKAARLSYQRHYMKSLLRVTYTFSDPQLRAVELRGGRPVSRRLRPAPCGQGCRSFTIPAPEVLTSDCSLRKRPAQHRVEAYPKGNQDLVEASRSGTIQQKKAANGGAAHRLDSRISGLPRSGWHPCT